MAEWRYNMSTLFVLPYLWIAPLLVSLIIGFGLQGIGGLLLFCTLRTLADLAAYAIEQHRLHGHGMSVDIE